MPENTLKPGQIEAVLIDLDGVLYVGGEAIPGADETLHWLVEQKIPHIFLTNTTSRPLSAIRDKLAGMGFDFSDSRILTPVVATNHWCAAQNISRALLLVPEATKADFELESVDESQAQAVVVGDLGYAWNYELLNRAFRTLMDSESCELIALGMTRYWKDEEGLRLDVAPFIKALEHASDKRARVLGKPSELLFQQACQMLDAAPENTLMIGDDVRTDVGGAQQAGLKGALVQTGKYSDKDLSGDIAPDVLLPSFADLPDWWQKT